MSEATRERLSVPDEEPAGKSNRDVGGPPEQKV